MRLNIVYLGLADYSETLDLQKKLQDLVINKLLDDTLVLLEHPAVLTMGVRGDCSNIYLSQELLDRMGINVYNVHRGGDVTYHGPGQIVGYPIFNLERHGKDVRDFIVKMQEVIIQLLAREYQIDAHRESAKYTGVWIENEKIAAIGIEVKRWTSMHGFAFNVNTDLQHYKWINPCGLGDRGVTSLEKITGEKQSITHLQQLITKYFCMIFGMEGHICTAESLIG